VSALVELEPGLFHRVRHLWAGMGMHLAVESILAKETAARMFVDDIESSRGAMTWTGHRLYLAGDVQDPCFGEALTEFASARGQFIAYCTTEHKDEVAGMLPGKAVKRNRRYYEVDPSTRKWATEPPEGYVIEPITGELLSLGLEHTDWVSEEMCSERASVEEFLGKSFGFAAVQRGGFACWCMSEYNLGDRCEVGIETVREYRRRGLAVLVAGTMFRHAASVGVRRIGWHCWSDNAGSVATAERLGLRRVAEFPVFSVDARVG
jgi:RimJ/RimL family protein N-acetyltransferase